LSIQHGIGKKFPEHSGETAFGRGIRGGTQDKPTLASIWSCVIPSNVADRGGGLALCDGFPQGNGISGNSAPGLERCNAMIGSNIISENGVSGLVDCYGTVTPKRNPHTFEPIDMNGFQRGCRSFIQFLNRRRRTSRCWKALTLNRQSPMISF
jgi:hypothetical protein